MKRKEIKIDQKNIYNILKIKNLRKQIKNLNLNSNIHTTEKNKSEAHKKSLIIIKNLKKHSITINKYYTFLIDSIILAHKSHMVTEFKNYLLWDENSEFLKKYYDIKDSCDRLSTISLYYQTYTLFAPVYFGLNAPLLVIMIHWTKKKKKYLEFIENKEDNDEKKKKKKKNKNKNFNFKRIIKSKLIKTGSSYYQNKSSNKKTLSLTRYDDVDSFFLRENNNETLLEKYNNNKKNNNQDINKDISLSKIMNDLSSNYSVYIDNCNNNKNCENQNDKKDYSKIQKKENKIEKNENDKYKNLILSDKTLFSYINLYKKRDRKIKNKKNLIKVYYCTTNNSNAKIKQNQNMDINKGKKIKDFKNKLKIKIYMPTNEPKISIKKKNNMNFNNLQITLNNLTRNKSSLKDKKENLSKNALTNSNITSYSNLTSTCVSKLKKRNEKIKKLYLRNLDNTNPQNNYKSNNNNTPLHNTTDTYKNKNNYTKNNKYTLTQLLTSKDTKNNKKYITKGNIINIKHFYSYRRISLKDSNNHINTKIINTHSNYGLFSYKINKLIKEKKIITCVNSFSNNKTNNKSNISKNKENKNIEKNKNNSNKNNKSNKSILTKRVSKGNLLRSIVLRKFHSKKEILHKNKFNINSPYFITPISRKLLTRNNSLSKSKKQLCIGKLNKKLKDLANIKPYKKELNKINLNLNFSINFNIDINKNRKKKLLISHKNNLGNYTQIKNQRVNKNKSRGSDNIHRKK